MVKLTHIFCDTSLKHNYLFYVIKKATEDYRLRELILANVLNCNGTNCINKQQTRVWITSHASVFVT